METQPPPPTEQWIELPDEPAPKPTAWPAILALAVTFIFWGLASSLVITGVGLLVFAVALMGWIGSIRHEHRD